jgi:mono/diheme cytochrome c family protein
MNVEPLHKVNGDGEFGVVCANCHMPLGKERAVASSLSGPKFFCKQERDVIDSCYLQWRRKLS